MKLQTSIVTVAAVLLLSGCTSTPTDTQARQVVEESFADIKQLGAGPLVDFTKLNGESLEQSGQKFYV